MLSLSSAGPTYLLCYRLAKLDLPFCSAIAELSYLTQRVKSTGSGDVGASMPLPVDGGGGLLTKPPPLQAVMTSKSRVLSVGVRPRSCNTAVYGVWSCDASYGLTGFLYPRGIGDGQRRGVGGGGRSVEEEARPDVQADGVHGGAAGQRLHGRR